DVDDWLALPEGGAFQELIDGDLVMTPSPSIEHQRIVARLLVRLAAYLADAGGGEVFPAPTGVRLSEHDILEPDLLVILPTGSARATERLIEGPPDLVIEVLSPGSAGRDLGEKSAIYERSGVAEYWIVDPVARRVEVLVADSAGFARLPADEAVQSRTLVGLELSLEEIFGVRR